MDVALEDVIYGGGAGLTFPTFMIPWFCDFFGLFHPLSLIWGTIHSLTNMKSLLFVKINDCMKWKDNFFFPGWAQLYHSTSENPHGGKVLKTPLSQFQLLSQPLRSFIRSRVIQPQYPKMQEVELLRFRVTTTMLFQMKNGFPTSDLHLCLEWLLGNLRGPTLLLFSGHEVWGNGENEPKLALLSHCRDFRWGHLVLEGPPSSGGSRRHQQKANPRKEQGSAGLTGRRRSKISKQI